MVAYRKWKMLKIIIIISMLLTVSACAESTTEKNQKDLTRQQRDSIIAESGLPGAGVVGKAIEVSDSLEVRAKKLDEQYK